MPDKTFYETIFNGVIFGSFFGIAYFSVDGLLKLADDQNKMLREQEKILREQEKILREQLEDCEEKLSQCKEDLN